MFKMQLYKYKCMTFWGYIFNNSASQNNVEMEAETVIAD